MVTFSGPGRAVSNKASTPSQPSDGFPHCHYLLISRAAKLSNQLSLRLFDFWHPMFTAAIPERAFMELDCLHLLLSIGFDAGCVPSLQHFSLAPQIHQRGESQRFGAPLRAGRHLVCDTGVGKAVESRAEPPARLKIPSRAISRGSSQAVRV
ncbi:hypothetical protein PM082_015624 [Marasmius tenuissimus]|nr:hypothetical protein PM082_015624 [Marasmius tenuissimus]